MKKFLFSITYILFYLNSFSQNFATIPYNIGFELGNVNEAMTFKSNNIRGQIEISNSNTPNTGNYHLLMAASTYDADEYVQNEAWLYLNLENETEVYLTFYIKDFGEETHSEDGIYFSDNGGSTFKKVFDLDGAIYTDNQYHLVSLNVHTLADNNNLDLTNSFIIKFQQYDNNVIGSDGFAIDDISVFDESTEWNGSVDTSWNRPSNWSNGRPKRNTYAIISDVSSGSRNYPELYSGINGYVGILEIKNGASISLNATSSLYVYNNWNNYGDSNIGDGNVVFLANENQQINGNTTFNDFTVNGISVSLGGAQIIKGTLDLRRGIIETTSTNLLTLNDNATITNCSDKSYISGPLSKIGDDKFTFCTGSGDQYAPIAISAPKNSNSQFTANYIYDGYGVYTHGEEINRVSVLEYWDLDRNVGSDSVTVTLYWEGVESAISTLSSLIVCHWNGSNWENKGGTASGDFYKGNIVSTSFFTSFSPITIGSTDGENPLPVELIDFNGFQNSKGNVTLNWSTAQEIDNDFFNIERSKDGVTFNAILRVEGKGNSSIITNYLAEDENPLSGTTYYRLKQVDNTGEFSYSIVISVYENLEYISNTAKKRLILFPNPSDGEHISIKFDENCEPEKKYDIKIYNILGKEIYSSEKIYGCIPKIHFPEPLNEGVYILSLTIDEGTYLNKFIVK